ncbi:hypothetical protein CERZMDRAFT_114417 [Cercospora zeae-maydis SCOH1-5]|uniref:Uncharacterized protein n=1 Tax=Cercospora zeae-maydis SCOH1-5 TaxID=717836 RepID=A0A6A6F4J7_9PEZI|nr:hypothetical protein CERZMDRAFT_114417 [Cercospora zeae-maydis SCOH1-5]
MARNATQLPDSNKAPKGLPRAAKQRTTLPARETRSSHAKLTSKAEATSSSCRHGSSTDKRPGA